MPSGTRPHHRCVDARKQGTCVFVGSSSVPLPKKEQSDRFLQTIALLFLKRRCGLFAADSAVQRLDLDGSAAEAFVDAVGDGQHRAPFGRAAQRFQYARFGLGVQIGGDLVEQQNGGVRRRCPREGQKLLFAL